MALLLVACEPAVRTSAFVEPATSRPYAVHTREGHDFRRPSPVLFVLHPYATAPGVLVDKYGLDRRAAARRDFIVVVPQGTRDADGHLSWNASAACCGAGPSRPDDLGYLRGVLEDLRRHAAIDRGRIYAFGESNGGFLAQRWACAGDLRAIVSIAGAAPGPDDPPCAPGRPVSVLEVHGDRDEMVRYEGGRTGRGRYPSAAGTIALWRRLDACDPAPRESRRSRLLFFAPLRVEAFTCPQARVVLWTREGGGHQTRMLRLWSGELVDFLDGG